MGPGPYAGIRTLAGALMRLVDAGGRGCTGSEELQGLLAVTAVNEDLSEMEADHWDFKAGFLRKQHPQCRDLHAEGIREMGQLATQAAGTDGFNETALRQTLQTIADGWVQGVSHALRDGILTNEEKFKLRDLRDRLALEQKPALQEASGMAPAGGTRPPVTG